MNIAVFNRFWTTQGGGERYAGAIAQALVGDHQVDLLSPTPVNWRAVEEHLGLDLSRAAPRTVPADPNSLTVITREYDVFVNCSYMSSDFNGARRGIYVVLFPVQGGSALRVAKRALARTLGPLVRNADVTVVWGNGFYPGERSGLDVFRWTTGEAHLQVTAPPILPTRLRIRLLAYRPRTSPARVIVEVDGHISATADVGSDFHPVTMDLDVAGRGPGAPVPVIIRSNVFVPGGDTRELGVPVASIQLDRGARSWLLARLPFLSHSWSSDSFLTTYHDVVSISNFTRYWVRRRWRRESHVIAPPVELLSGDGAKDPIILSVGRFFDQQFGHSKKQLEMVRAFRSLVSCGVQGWELHLVGGCQQQHAGYLARVRAEANGLPVRFHIDIPREGLRDLYRRASIYWHATGLGESERRHPERLEHFGISTVEAMSAGLVPIVLGKAGQQEIVQDQVNGFHFRTVQELVARTRLVVEDEALRARIALAARARAREFSTARFAARVRRLVEDPASA